MVWPLSAHKRAVSHRAPRSSLALLALVALSVGGVDCAEERAPISQVQEGLLPKSFFVGANYTDPGDDPQFYMNNFIVESSADNSMMPVGTYDDVDRVHWEIQENLLLARKTYEYVNGTDRRPSNLRNTPQGLIVAAYRIESQVDVRNGYNPTTGEPTNVITENQTDRRWYDRDFIRVDWSRNLVDNPDWSWVWYGSVFGDLSFQPVAFNETNVHSPNANNFCEMQPGMVRGANGECTRATNPRNHPGGYFDVTSKWLVNPENSMFFGEPIPTCLIANFFSHGPVYSCNPQESTIRTSFRRVEDHDFEPLEQTVAPYDLVGGPRADVNGWDPGYGINDVNQHRYAMIHNLWQRSHLSPTVECSANTDADNDGTADACGATTDATRAGSQCDMVMHKCTLPYRRREVRPIVYYTNPEMPAEMQDHITTAGAEGNDTYRLPTDGDPASAIERGASEDIIASWNIAIMSAIANAREVECRRTGGERDACHAQYFDAQNVPAVDGAWLAPRPKDSNGPAVVLCHNPVRRGDSSACREPGYSVRLGDIRYNHITYIPGASRAPFGGIAHWGYDPLTGEVVSNGGTNMGRSAEAAAATQRDYILLALGELSVDDYVAGGAATRFAQALRNPSGAVAGRASDAEIDARSAAVNGYAAASSTGLHMQPARNAQAGLATHDRALYDSAPISAESSVTTARWEALASQLRNTTVEADMVDPHWLANLGFDPNSQRTQALLDQVSPLRRMDPETAEAGWQRLQQRLEARGFCFQDAGAPPVVGSQDLQGVARWFARKYQSVSAAERSRRIYNDLRVEAYKGIALHEIGHSLGLYHLPVSSYDSMNYNPQYWQLRSREGRAQSSCVPVCTQNNCPNTRNADRNNDNCMGPRYLDPYTDDELGIDNAAEPHAGVNYFGNTSVMEYQWERFDETVGIGSYDHYAMGILYGRVIETMDQDLARGGLTPDQQDRYSARLRSQLSELDQINWHDPVLDESGVLPIHYTELARQLQIFDPSRCRDATAEEKAQYKWRIVDGKICSLYPRDHASMVDFESSTTSATSDRVAPMWRTHDHARTGAHSLRWGYRVAWDIGTGYPHINYFDQGADVYEVAQSMIRKYELTYPTLYFRRGNREYTGLNIPSYLARSVFRLLRGYHWSVARDAAYYSAAFSSDLYGKLSRDDNWLRPYLQAGPQIFDFFAGVMLRPEVGTFTPMTDQVPGTRPLFDVPDTLPDDLSNSFEVGVIDGRYIGEEYDNTRGGSWDYHSFMNRAGSYPEKPIAAIMLTDTRPTFSSITRSLYLDGREFQVNFHTDMPQAFDRLLGGILAEDWDATAMHVVPQRVENSTSMIGQPSLLPLWTAPTRTDVFGEPRRPTDARLVFPNIGYRQQLPTYIYSMLFSSLNSDLQTIHKMRVWVEGGPEQIDVPEEDRVRFRNPETGITYVARRYGTDRVDGLEIDRGIGSRMIRRANQLVMDTYAVQRDASLRPIIAADGSVTVVLDPVTRQPLPANNDARRQVAAVTRFQNYVGLIDAARYTSRLLGYGTLH